MQIHRHRLSGCGKCQSHLRAITRGAVTHSSRSAGSHSGSALDGAGALDVGAASDEVAEVEVEEADGENDVDAGGSAAACSTDQVHTQPVVSGSALKLQLSALRVKVRCLTSR